MLQLSDEFQGWIRQGGFIDVHHDGTLQMVSNGTEPRSIGSRLEHPDILLRLGPNGYQEDRPVLLAVTIQARWDDFLRNQLFRLTEDSDGPYRIRFINGDAKGRNRATGAKVLLNGKVIATSAQINGSVEFWELELGSWLGVGSWELNL